MSNLDSILKNRDITLPTKVHLVKAVVFPVVMYGCESWSIKKAECRRIDAFELWCWRRLLRVPWTARRSNQSILKEISPDYSLEGLMLKLKLQYLGHLRWRAHSLEEKTLMLGKSEGRRRDDRGWGSWMASPTQGHEFEQVLGVGDGQGGLVCLQAMGSQRVRQDWATELNRWQKIGLCTTWGHPWLHYPCRCSHSCSQELEEAIQPNKKACRSNSSLPSLKYLGSSH